MARLYRGSVKRALFVVALSWLFIASFYENCDASRDDALESAAAEEGTDQALDETVPNVDDEGSLLTVNDDQGSNVGTSSLAPKANFTTGVTFQNQSQTLSNPSTLPLRSGTGAGHNGDPLPASVITNQTDSQNQSQTWSNSSTIPRSGTGAGHIGDTLSPTPASVITNQTDSQPASTLLPRNPAAGTELSDDRPEDEESPSDLDVDSQDANEPSDDLFDHGNVEGLDPQSPGDTAGNSGSVLSGDAESNQVGRPRLGKIADDRGFFQSHSEIVFFLVGTSLVAGSLVWMRRPSPQSQGFRSVRANNNVELAEFSGLEDGDDHIRRSSYSSPEYSDPNDASEFFREALGRIKIPPYAMQKYVDVLSTNYLTRVDQLRALDANDWKRLDLPEVIKSALRDRLEQHSGERRNSVDDNRKRGLQLKAVRGESAVAPMRGRVPSARRGRMGAEEVKDDDNLIDAIDLGFATFESKKTGDGAVPSDDWSFDMEGFGNA